MSDRRKAQKNHIRAARDWLGQAEHSLDNENDVRGDLKLMLAKAELAQVKDSPRSAKIKRYAGRVLPALVAVCLVVVGMAALPQGKTVPMPPQQDASVPAETVVEKTSAAEQLSPRQETEALPAKEASDSQPISDTVPKAAQAAKVPERTQAMQAREDTSAPVKASGRTPDAETQKLMQSAGKVLRQQ